MADGEAAAKERKRDRLKRFARDPFAKGMSDLYKRTVSAIVMVAVAGAALWFGGWAWLALVLAVDAMVLIEWRRIVARFQVGLLAKVLWLAGGILYVGIASVFLLAERIGRDDLFPPAVDDGLADLWPHPGFYEIWAVLTLVLVVIAVDVGAYFAGRTIGGPKIAPRISPAKTWAGLGGGIVAAWLVQCVLGYIFVTYIELCDIDGLCDFGPAQAFALLGSAVLVGVVAQAGDFFESWMKRRAGLKDSGTLIPGHGGVFDRVDGLLAVSFVLSVLYLLEGIGA